MIENCKKCDKRKTCHPYSSLKELCEEIKKRTDEPTICSDDTREARLQLIMEIEKSLLKTLSKNCLEK